MTDIIKYANCWEDADLLLTAAKINPPKHVLSIASGGDNSFALLSLSPDSLCAADVNPVQLYLCELKAAAFAELSHPEMLDLLLGASHAKELFHHLKQQLSPACKAYWQNNEHVIASGLLHSGKFEHYFRFFRQKIMPLIHSKKTIQQLLAPKSQAAQADFYHQTWDNKPWRFLFKLFFSKFVMGRFGRTKAYLDQVEIPVAHFIYEQAAQHLQSQAAQSNYFLHYIFTGEFAPALPFYLREENFASIKQNIHKLSLKQAYVHQVIDGKTAFDFCNFSNIFEYMNHDVFDEFHQHLKQNLSPNATICYWNLMVDRVFSDTYPKDFSRAHLPDPPSDKGFFYKQFITETKNG